MNLMTTTNFNKEEALEQLRQGNTDVLKGLPASLTLQLGIELQKEQGYKEPSPIDNKELEKAMVVRLKDGEVKEMLIKRIEEEKANEITS